MFRKDSSLTFYVSSNVQREAGESPGPITKLKVFFCSQPGKFGGYGRKF